jgi:alpha-tubulin suppressor-like RCC1 family protein
LVEDLEGVTALSAGWGVTCALKSDKTVACWGDGYYGQLGDEPPSNTLTVVPIAGLTDVAQVAVGWEHVCVRQENGTVACWGSNANGELGTGELIEAYDPYALPPQSTSPVEVVGLSNVTNLAAGGGHTCATVATGETYCWGRNGVGILGTGETESSTTPVEVVFP